MTTSKVTSNLLQSCKYEINSQEPKAGLFSLCINALMFNFPSPNDSSINLEYMNWKGPVKTWCYWPNLISNFISWKTWMMVRKWCGSHGANVIKWKRICACDCRIMSTQRCSILFACYSLTMQLFPSDMWKSRGGKVCR